ncbi:MAG: hypothetical protein LBU24_01820 [Methanocalculaceae archaeon]|jgi:hypothetical protein|nr:hypothetical protein [Methanocalculaceae archaeon]
MWNDYSDLGVRCYSIGILPDGSLDYKYPIHEGPNTTGNHVIPQSISTAMLMATSIRKIGKSEHRAQKPTSMLTAT